MCTVKKIPIFFHLQAKTGGSSRKGRFGIKTECLRSCGSVPGGVLKPCSSGRIRMAIGEVMQVLAATCNTKYPESVFVPSLKPAHPQILPVQTVQNSCLNQSIHQAGILNINRSVPAGFHHTFLSHMEILRITFKGW